MPGWGKRLVAAGWLAAAAGCGESAREAAPGQAGTSGPSVAARIGDRTITVDEIDERARRMDIEPYQALWNARKEALEQIVAEHLLDTEAAARGITREALIEQEVNARIESPAADQIRAYHEQNPGAMRGRSVEEMSPLIRNQLASQSRQRALRTFLESLQARSGVEVSLPPPRVPVAVAANDPTRGPDEAPVRILEFADFQCGYCARIAPVLDRVVQSYGDKVQVVFRDFPLSFHPRAQVAAEAAQCAHAQGKFWEYHDKLFQDQKALGDEQLRTYAVEVGLAPAAFEECLRVGRFRNDVTHDMADGSRAGVRGTPALFVNGRFLSGNQSFEALARVIDDELRARAAEEQGN